MKINTCNICGKDVNLESRYDDDGICASFIICKHCGTISNSYCSLSGNKEDTRIAAVNTWNATYEEINKVRNINIENKIIEVGSGTIKFYSLDDNIYGSCMKCRKCNKETAIQYSGGHNGFSAKLSCDCYSTDLLSGKTSEEAIKSAIERYKSMNSDTEILQGEKYTACVFI